MLTRCFIYDLKTLGRILSEILRYLTISSVINFTSRILFSFFSCKNNVLKVEE